MIKDSQDECVAFHWTLDTQAFMSHDLRKPGSRGHKSSSQMSLESSAHARCLFLARLDPRHQEESLLEWHVLDGPGIVSDLV